MRIYKYCFQNNYFPVVWKTARILPLSKPDYDQLFPQNCRTIILLNSLSEILEKLTSIRILKVLVKNKIIREAKFGFRLDRCTVRQLARVTFIIISHLRSNNGTTQKISKSILLYY